VFAFFFRRLAAGGQLQRANARRSSPASEMEKRVSELRSDYASEHGAPAPPVSVTAPHWFCTELLLPSLPRLLNEGPCWTSRSPLRHGFWISHNDEADVALRNSGLTTASSWSDARRARVRYLRVRAS